MMIQSYSNPTQRTSTGLGINITSSTPNRSGSYPAYIDQSYPAQLVTPSTVGINGAPISSINLTQNSVLNGSTPTQSNIRSAPNSRSQSGPLVETYLR